MKLQMTQHGKTVTIETERDDLTSFEMVEQLRCLMLAQDYHPDLVSEAMPDEEEIDKIISDGIKELDNRSDCPEDRGIL